MNYEILEGRSPAARRRHTPEKSRGRLFYFAGQGRSGVPPLFRNRDSMIGAFLIALVILAFYLWLIRTSP